MAAASNHEDATGGSRAVRQLSVGAVVTNYNGGRTVMDCLAALQGSETPPLEIVVVDNASTDGSAELISGLAPGVRLCRLKENKGPSVARNIGLRELSTDLALLVDADIYVASDTLSLLLEAFNRSKALAVCPRIVLFPDTDTIQADGVGPHFLGSLSLRHGYTSVQEHPSLPTTPQFTAVKGTPSACFLIDRVVAIDVGGFDESYFFYFEDLEFNIRLRALGHDIVCAQRAVVQHDRGLGTPELSFRGKGDYPVNRFYLSARNRLTTIGTYYRLWSLLILAPPLTAYELVTFIFAVRNGFYRAWLRAWAWQFQNWGPIRQKRKTMQAMRKRADRELLVGGPIPVAPGLVTGWALSAGVSLMSRLFGLYWRLVRPLLRL